MLKVPQIILSEVDSEILARTITVDHPSAFSPLVDILPDDTSGIEPVGAYSIKHEDPRGLANCGACRRHHNHNHGIVLRLKDGTYSTLGRHCAQHKHGLNHQEIYNRHEKQMRRATALRRAMYMVECAQSVAEYLESIVGLPQVVQLSAVLSELERKFPKLHQYLSTSNGRLFTRHWITDELAMAERRKKRERKIARLERETLTSNISPEYAAHYFKGDPIFSNDPIKVERKRLFAQFKGSAIFARPPRVESTVFNLTERIGRSLSIFEGTPTGLLEDQAISGSVSRFRKTTREAIALLDDLNEATKFCSQEVILQIANWANLRRDISAKSTFSAGPGYLTQDFGEGYIRSMVIPEVLPSISTKLLKDTMISVSDAEIDEEIDEVIIA